MKTIPYWLDGTLVAHTATPVAGRVDVAIIGGGVTGCACALELARAGARVRLYDAGAIGGGASGRNGGFALRGASVPYDELVARLGSEDASSLMALTERGLDRMAELAGDSIRRVGSLRIAVDDVELRRLEAEHDALVADGFGVDWLDDLDPPLDRLYAAAILHPRDGAIHPGRWLERLAARAGEAGAVLIDSHPVGVDEALSGADAVVVATDGYTSALLPELAELVRPTRGQVLATEPLDELRFPRPHYARDGYDYWQQLPDGRLVLGGCRDADVDSEWTAADAATGPVQQRLELLLGDLVGRMPTITHRWSGAWGTTPDGLPLVGRLPTRERAWIAAGYSGHGNVLGFVCGGLVADAIGGRATAELTLFDPARFG